MRHICVWLLVIIANGRMAAQTTNYTYDDAGRLTRAGYPNGKTVTYVYDKAGNLLRRLVTTATTGPTPVASAEGVANAASYQGGPVAPGEIVTIFGSNLGPAELAGAALTRLGFIDNYVGETTVLFDGVPAPVVYASNLKTSVIVPYSVAGKANTQVIIEFQGRRSAPVTVPVVAAAPGIFSFDSSGKGAALVFNQDSSFNTSENPAGKGSVIVFFGTGEGQTNPPGVDGRRATAVFPKPAQKVVVRIGGVEAELRYAGAVPEQVAGLFQINAVVPEDAPSGNVPLLVTVGAASSQAGLTVAVR